MNPMGPEGYARWLINAGCGASARAALEGQPGGWDLNNLREEARRVTLDDRIHALAVVDGRGWVVLVGIEPGPPLASDDMFRDACKTARTVAKVWLPGAEGMPQMRVDFEESIPVRGDSVGLAAVLGIVERYGSRPLGRPVLATGRIEANGKVREVESIKEKLRIAEQEAISTLGAMAGGPRRPPVPLVLVPVQELDQALGLRPWPMEVVAVETVDEALRLVFGDVDELEVNKKLLRKDARLVGEQSNPQPFRKPPTGDENPFRDLESYEFRDAHLFFGREREIEAVMRLLGQHPLVIVTGNSGSGKTSLLQAGVAPRLAENGTAEVTRGGPYRPGGRPRLRVVPMWPGPDPWGELVEVLAETFEEVPEAAAHTEPKDLAAWASNWGRQADARLVLIVDQAEQLFTQSERSSQEAFCRGLAALLQRTHGAVRVLLGVRDDFASKLRGLPDLGPLCQTPGVVYLGTPDEVALREILEAPARRQARRFEDGLVDRMVAGVVGSPAALTLLSATASELWRKSQDGVLPLAAYDQLGGVRGVLRIRAKEATQQLTKQFSDAARAVIVRLVAGDATGGKTTRVRRRVAELATLAGVAEQQAKEIVAYLVAQRLLVTGRGDGEGGLPETGDEVELAHEALIEEWVELKKWWEVDGRWREHEDRIEQAAHKWDQDGRKRSRLWNREDLADHRLLMERAADKAHLTTLAEEFVAAAEAAERRRRKRAAVAVATVIALLLAFGLASLFAWYSGRLEQQRGEAREATALSRRPARSVDALAHAVTAATGGAGFGAAVLRTVQRTPPVETVRGLFDALASGPSSGVLATGLGGQAADLSGDERLLAVGGSDGSLGVWSLKLRKQLWSQRGWDSIARSVAFSATSRRFAGTGYGRGGGRGFYCAAPDCASKRTGDFAAIALSPRDRWTATATWGGSVELRDAEGGRRALLQDVMEAQLAFSPTGDFLAITGTDARLRLFDNPDAPRQVLALACTSEKKVRINSVTFSKSGQYVALSYSRASGAQACLWRKDGQDWHEVRGGDRPLTGVVPARGSFEGSGNWNGAFSADESRLLTYEHEGNDAFVWSLPSGELIARLGGHRVGITAAALSPDGETALTADRRGLIRAWDIRTGVLGGGSPEELVGHTGIVAACGFFRDGRRAYSVSADGTARLWDLSRAGNWGFLGSHRSAVADVLVSDDGKRLLTLAVDGSARLWSTSSFDQLAAARVPCELRVAALTAVGDHVALGCLDGSVWLWGANSTSPAVLPPAPRSSSDAPSPVVGLVFSADGQRLVAFSRQGSVRRWTLGASQRPVNEQRLGHEISAVAWSAPTSHALITSPRGELSELDLRALQERALSGGCAGEALVSSAISPGRGYQLVSTAAGRTCGVGAGWPLPRRQLDGRVSRSTTGFSQDGSRFVLAGPTGAATVWDVVKKKAVHLGQAHVQPLIDAAISPSGRMVATVSAGGTVRAYEVDTGRELLAVGLGAPGARLVAFVRHGKWIVVGCDDGTVRLFTVDLEDALQTACGAIAAAGREAEVREECERVREATRRARP